MRWLKRIVVVIALLAITACNPHRSDGAGGYLCSCPEFEAEVAGVDWFNGGEIAYVDSGYPTRDAAPPAYVEVSATDVADRSERVDELRAVFQGLGWDIEDQNDGRFKAILDGASVLVIGDRIDPGVMVVIVGADPADGLPSAIPTQIGVRR